MEREGLTKSVGFFISLTIIIILFISSPAQAYILGLISSSSNVQKGDKVNFYASVKAEANEQLNIDHLNLKLVAQDNIPNIIECNFLTNGTIINGCSGMTIKNISSVNDSNSGYGYGYGNENLLEYNITIDTSTYLPLIYETYFTIFIENETIEHRGGNIAITSVIEPLKDSCSIRAKDSRVSVGEKSFLNPKLNFYIPLKNAVKGGGYLIAQKNRETFSYEFKNIKVIENNDKNLLLLLVSGKYRIGLEDKIPETSVIVLNKITNKIDIIGDKVNINGMDIYFKQGCS